MRLRCFINCRIDPPECVNAKRTAEGDGSSGSGGGHDCGDGDAMSRAAVRRKERDCEDAGLVKSWRPFSGLAGDLLRKKRSV